MDFQNIISTTDESTEKLFDLINQIIEIPDEAIDQDQVDILLGMINGSLTPKLREESVLAIVEEMKNRPYSECKTMVEAMGEMADELIDELNVTSEHKQNLIRGIFKMFESLAHEALERLEGYDTIVHFELIHPAAKVPTYAHETDAGADVYCVETIEIPAHAQGFKVGVGFKMAMAPGWEMQVRPRSGMSYKTPLRVANAPGTIDAGYRDEVAILFDNIGDFPYTIEAGERIAQFVITPVHHFKGIVVDDINAISGNREGGFGSTGK